MKNQIILLKLLLIFLIIFTIIFGSCDRRSSRTNRVTQTEQSEEIEQYNEDEQHNEISDSQTITESSSSAQARLTIENKSQRFMTVKIMKGDTIHNSLHKMVTISANKSSTVYFSQTGYYFTKTKAELDKKEPVYQKGEPFEVVNDSRGYSVMTITFTIKETEVPEVLGGKRITKTEFDKD